MLKVVIDTNQFISGIISKKGASAQLLKVWENRAYISITSREIIEEIKRVLQYPHISQKYNLKEKDIDYIINLIEHESLILFDPAQQNVIKEDPSDNKFLACAVEAGTDYIISGDKHLLNLREYKNISIVTVQEFLELLK